MQGSHLSDISRRVIDAFRYGQGTAYFERAESLMEEQWCRIIYPIIKDMDFSCVLDFAAGHGRNSAKLLALSRQLIIVDPSPDSIFVLKQRFSTPPSTCKITIIQNSGIDLHDVESSSVTLLYSWDAMVHFDKRLVDCYMPEFARVLRPGGRCFLHHSNFGRISQGEDFQNHPAWRSNVDKDTFARSCFANGLIVTRQILLPWPVPDIGQVKELDCISVVAKPLLTAV
jgi:SAM-dependent methyltransferase